MSGVEQVMVFFKHYLGVGCAVFLCACTTTGPVSTEQADSHYEIVLTPKEFVSPLEEINSARRQTMQSEIRIKGQKHYTRQEWFEYASWMQSWDELEYEQSRLEHELADIGELELIPGRSYSFDLESYCVQGGSARPVTGDEFKVAPLHGPAEAWLPKILNNQGRFGFSRERVQYLIWSLLYDVRFDELSEDNQKMLLKFYPDAAVRFGNRRLEEFGRNTIREVLPPEINGALDRVAEYRERVLALKSDYRKLEELLVPYSDRTKPIPVGWMKMPDGYLIRLTSDSYSRIRVDVYVPNEDERPGRSPQAIKKSRKFRPWQWIALPAKGQRLAISTKSIPREKPKIKTACEELKNWKPTHCREMTAQDRAKLLEQSSPMKFQRTWYAKRPSDLGTIEESTDCSHFVYEILRRNGFSYNYSPTSTFSCLSVFKEIPETEAQPGDVVLYSAHVGILSANDAVISATRGGEEMRSVLPPGGDKKKTPPYSAITELPKNQAGNGPWKILRWSCP